MSKLKNIVDWFNPLTEKNSNNEIYLSKYVSGTPGSGAVYEDRKLREQNLHIWNYTEVEISSAEILDIGETPKQLLPTPGVNKYYEAKILLEYTHVSTPYSLYVDLSLNGAGDQYITKSLITNSFNGVCKVDLGSQSYLDSSPEYVYSNVIGINEAVNLTTYDNSNPTLGNGTFLVKIWYKVEIFGSNL